MYWNKYYSDVICVFSMRLVRIQLALSLVDVMAANYLKENYFDEYTHQVTINFSTTIITYKCIYVYSR